MVSETFTASTSNGSTVTVAITETATSVSANQSTLSVTVSASVYSEVTESGAVMCEYTVTIAGNELAGKFSRSSAGSASKAFAATSDAATITVTHNIDGTCEADVNISADIQEDYSYGGSLSGYVTAEASDTCALTDIPQDYISSFPDTETGDTCAITWVVTDATYYYELVLSCGSYSASISDTPGETGEHTYNYTFTNSVWANLMTSSESATVTAKLYTYTSSGTQVMTSSATMTLTVAESITPSLSVTISDAAGYADTFGYLMGYSKVAWIAEQETELYGATETYSVVICGTTYNAASGTTAALAVSGTQSWSVTVTDSRGRSDTISGTIYVYTYIAPAITSISVTRGKEDPTIASLSLSATYETRDGTNTIESVAMSTKVSTAASYGDAVSLDFDAADGEASASYTWDAETFAETSSYDIRIEITDTVGYTLIKTVRLSTTAALLGLRAGGKGLGVGKLPEGDYFDIGMDVVINSGYTLTLGDKVILIDYGSAQLEQLPEEESDSETEEESESETAEGKLTAEITFATAFTSAPHVILTLESDSPADGVVISVSDITESGCVAWAYWPDGYSATVHWLAIGA